MTNFQSGRRREGAGGRRFGLGSEMGRKRAQNSQEVGYYKMMMWFVFWEMRCALIDRVGY